MNRPDHHHDAPARGLSRLLIALGLASLLCLGACGSCGDKKPAPAPAPAPAPEAARPIVPSTAAADKALADKAREEAAAKKAAETNAKPPEPEREPTLEELGFKVPKPEPPFKEWMRQPLTIKGIGLATPEAALYDAEKDTYYISNIQGNPLDKDGNGFITRVNTDVKIPKLKWIDGTAAGVELDAPKGMAVARDLLWVADIDSMRFFDRGYGAYKGTLLIEGATFLNGVVADEDGAVYVSDSGLKAGEDGFEPSGTDAIYRINPDDTITKLISGRSLKSPNGLAWHDGKLWVVTFGSDELFSLTIEGDTVKRGAPVKLPSGSLDGIVALADGTFYITSWDKNAVYKGPAAGPFETLLSPVISPAALTYDTRRDRLLVPLFTRDKCLVHPLRAADE